MEMLYVVVEHTHIQSHVLVRVETWDLLLSMPHKLQAWEKGVKKITEAVRGSQKECFSKSYIAKNAIIHAVKI
jgi:hypothetical protein